MSKPNGKSELTDTIETFSELCFGRCSFVQNWFHLFSTNANATEYSLRLALFRFYLLAFSILFHFHCARSFVLFSLSLLNFFHFVYMCVLCACSFFSLYLFHFPKFIVSVYLLAVLLLLLFSFLFSFVFHEKWRTHQNHFTPNNIVELVLSVFMVMMMIPIRCSTHYTQYSHPSIHTNHQRNREYSGNGVIGSTAPRKINKCTVKMHKSMLKHTAKE